MSDTRQKETNLQRAIRVNRQIDSAAVDRILAKYKDDRDSFECLSELRRIGNDRADDDEPAAAAKPATAAKLDSQAIYRKWNNSKPQTG